MAMDDTALIQRAVANPGSSAFTELVKRHQSSLRYSLRQLTGGDLGLADDIAQETFIRAHRTLAGFRGDAKFSTWLYRIASRLLIDHHRKRRETLGRDQDIQERADPGVAENEAQDLHRDLARAMLHLSIDQRLVLHLTLMRDYTQTEVADLLDWPLGTVKSHIQRGRERLQQVLSDWQPHHD